MNDNLRPKPLIAPGWGNRDWGLGMMRYLEINASGSNARDLSSSRIKLSAAGRQRYRSREVARDGRSRSKDGRSSLAVSHQRCEGVRGLGFGEDRDE